ncbi:MazG-like family protein [Actinobacillus pleuropneumoniae]|uniref:MazG-like family protein n=1 Tax=Actinobacillus pleuropneumoniae TaxID=715 RepID=UPI000584741B|nr:MazG-like family protein [Actinobacillus pleuropneumoniae]KIE87722.1 putative pyrophosphatase [Actinobacillus pleuropneumoniae]KIE92336.1 putative pyrophosphatase [Actinobacillus pleuropneumoniae]KIE97732.1 putative pyrophosphatase [Actinobacillus pleuropneumoniae]KIE99259.1 putative pyrophosphatase [Actinobacillus pleuropneumoniae]QXP22526.1 MazG-like family protein [Actinobacillus pleuropneumoniae serovar 8 str. 405]
MQQLIKQVEQWADDRNLIDGSNPKKQMLKLMEEFGELCGGIAKNKPEVIKDSIGDCLVVTIILACQMKASRWFIDKALVDSDCSTENNEFICMRLAGVLGNLSKLIIFRNGIYNINEVYSNFYKIVYFLNKLAINKEINLESCLSLAWQEIKDRKGRMIDGVFVKEEDL